MFSELGKLILLSVTAVIFLNAPNYILYVYNNIHHFTNANLFT